MLQARPEQPGDSPSPEAGSALQQPQNNLQPTGTTGANGTSTPQTTPTVTQQQLQTPNLRVGDTQTLIANSTVAQAGTASSNPATVWLWAILPIVLFVVVVWRISKMTAANSAIVTREADAPSPTSGAPMPVTSLAPAPSSSPEQPRSQSKKSKKPAKGSRRQRKQKR